MALPKSGLPARERFIVALRTAAHHQGVVEIRGQEARTLADLLEAKPSSKLEADYQAALEILGAYEGSTVTERLQSLLAKVGRDLEVARLELER